jgi:lipopolysaccharide transport system ATP-binding protein
LRTVAGTEEVIGQYLADGADALGEVNFEQDRDHCPGSECIRLLAVRIRNHRGLITNALDVRHPFTIEMQYRILRPIGGLNVGLRVLTSDGVSVFTTRDLEDGHEEQLREPGCYVSRCSIPGNFLNYGQHFVSFGADCGKVLGHFSLHQVLSFQIEATGGVGAHLAQKRLGVLRMRFPWEIEPLPSCQVIRREEP